MISKLFAKLTGRVRRLYAFYIYPGPEWSFPLGPESDFAGFLRYLIERDKYKIGSLDDDFILTKRFSVVDLAGLTGHQELQFRSDGNNVIGNFRPTHVRRSVFHLIAGLLVFMLLASLLIGVYITFFEDNEASVWVRLVSFLLVYPLMIMVSYLMFECVVLMFRFWSWTGKWFRNRLYEDLLRAAQVRYVDEEDV